MKESLKRFLEKGKDVYVIDYWGGNNGTKAFVSRATVLNVDSKNKRFLLFLYGDTYIRYKFEDYGRLIFDDESKANSVACKIPDPGSIVFQIIGQKVYSKVIRCVHGKNVNGIYDLFFEFDRGHGISIKELGQTIFSNREEARKHLSSMYDETVIFENKTCTCCNDVYKILELPGDLSHTTIILYKTKIIDINRKNFGWCYYLTMEDDEFPIVLTEKAANTIIKKPEKALDLVNNRWFDRYE